MLKTAIAKKPVSTQAGFGLGTKRTCLGSGMITIKTVWLRSGNNGDDGRKKPKLIVGWKQETNSSSVTRMKCRHSKFLQHIKFARFIHFYQRFNNTCQGDEVQISWIWADLARCCRAADSCLRLLYFLFQPTKSRFFNGTSERRPAVFVVTKQGILSQNVMKAHQVVFVSKPQTISLKIWNIKKCRV